MGGEHGLIIETPLLKRERGFVSKGVGLTKMGGMI